MLDNGYQKPDVIVVGAGFAGCATAYYLAKAGVAVTLLERDSVGSCASGLAAGLLNALDGNGIPAALEPLAKQSSGMHSVLTRDIKDATGIDAHLTTLTATWLLFEESQSEAIGAIEQLASRMGGLSTIRLSGQDLRSQDSRFSKQAIGALRVEGTMRVECYEYTLGLAKAAEGIGVEIKKGTVRGLKKENGRICGLIVDDSEINCDKVVLAMGPWTGLLGSSWLGIDLPVKPIKGQILRLKYQGNSIGQVIYDTNGGYIAPKADGLIWVGTTEEDIGFNEVATEGARKSIMRRVARMMPDLSDAELVAATTCLRPVSADGLPFIGAVPGLDGAYIVTGAGRKGIFLGPALGKAMADIVMSGATHLPVEHFSLSRLFQPRI